MEPAALALVAATFLFITGAPCVMSLQLPTMPIPTALTNLASVNGSNITLPDIMYFPDDRGEPKPGRINGWALAEPVKESDVFFKLYTRAGPEEGEVIPRGDADALRNSTFNASAPTRVVIHGFIQSSESNTVQAIKDAYIANLDGNVIAVDWSKISRNWLYFVVKAQADQVGGLIAAFVEFLVRVAGVDVSDVHLSGYSLGAHVAGIAGKNIRVLVGKKAGRITGLDPAGPLYSVLDRGSRLDRADANFVDVIHTCGGWLGMGDPIGHVDFYPNGGVLRQPGCSWDIVLAGTCSHGRSWEYFVESIPGSRFSSGACATYVDYLRDNCNESPKVPMGQTAPPSTRGSYYLKTAETPPYAMG
ncbi:pancreatic triacylglycerol lipase-like isoform X2 [Hetaerina americana]|uniref:pancreatic triacylglycerol lipase-like isoform X2 n=1 Tax=Hetaerina americana TaxID=62018 RepID=UPI003A7F4CE5